jgi:hypothetical protein
MLGGLTTVPEPIVLPIAIKDAPGGVQLSAAQPLKQR